MGLDICRPDDLICSTNDNEKCHKLENQPRSHRSGKPLKAKKSSSQRSVQAQKKAEGLWDQESEEPQRSVKDFWEAQNRKRVQDKRMNKKKKPKPKEWKYKNYENKHEDKGLLTSGARPITNAVSPRDANGKLRTSLHARRKQGLQEIKAEEKQRKQQFLQESRAKRNNSMRVLDGKTFEAAQEAVSQVLFKRPEEYELANNENTTALLQGMHRILGPKNSSSTLSQDAKLKELVEVLTTAGVLTNSDDSTLEESCNPPVLWELNMNASPFLHTVDDMEKDTFVSTICELIRERPTFKEVKFNYGALKESHVVELAASLQKCEDLQEIHLDSNYFADKGLQALSKVLLTHRETITTLSMQNLPQSCTFSTQVLEEFVVTLEQCTAFVNLGFDMQDLRHQEFKDRVTRLLKKNSARMRLERLKAKREKIRLKS